MPTNPIRALTPKPRPRKQPVTITLDEPLLAQLDARGDNRSDIVRTDLGRYYRLLAEARSKLRELLTPAELSAVIDVHNGHWSGERLEADRIWANVEDGCRLDGLNHKWTIDGPALVAKLKSLDLLAVHALADATQRFWHAVGEGDHREPARALD